MRSLMRLPKEGNAEPQIAFTKAAQLLAEERKGKDEEVMTEIDSDVTVTQFPEDNNGMDADHYNDMELR